MSHPATALLYPPAGRPAQLAALLCGFFAALAPVRRVVVFGSQATGGGDRWSDVDLLVVTPQLSDYRQVLAALHAYKPIVHHAPVRPSTDHPGLHALGIVFADESVFHSLDLNFMALAAYQAPGALRWFGLTRECYAADGPDPVSESEAAPALPPPDLDELAIDAANYWTKRAARRVLRGQGSRDDLARRARDLGALARCAPADCSMPGGNPCRLARTYLAIAAALPATGADDSDQM
jgi:Nucleotidyltransferase domain